MGLPGSVSNRLFTKLPYLLEDSSVRCEDWNLKSLSAAVLSAITISVMLLTAKSFISCS